MIFSLGEALTDELYAFVCLFVCLSNLLVLKLMWKVQLHSCAFFVNAFLMSPISDMFVHTKYSLLQTLVHDCDNPSCVSLEKYCHSI